MTSFILCLLHTVRWLKGRLILNRSRFLHQFRWAPASCGISDADLTAPGYSTLCCSEFREQESTAGPPSLALPFRASWVPLHPLTFRRGEWFLMGSIGIFPQMSWLSPCLTFSCLDSMNQESSRDCFFPKAATAHPVCYAFCPGPWSHACWVWITAQHSLLMFFFTVHTVLL